MTACVYSLHIGVISQASPYTKAGTWPLAVSKPPPQTGCRTRLHLVPPPDPLLPEFPDLGISRGECCLTSPLGSWKASSVSGHCPHSPQQDRFQGHLYPGAQPLRTFQGCSMACTFGQLGWKTPSKCGGQACEPSSSEVEETLKFKVHLRCKLRSRPARDVAQ